MFNLDYKELRRIEESIYPQELDLEIEEGTTKFYYFYSKFMRDIFLMSLGLNNKLRFNFETFDIVRVREFEAINTAYLGLVEISKINGEAYISLHKECFDKDRLCSDYLYFKHLRNSKTIKTYDKGIFSLVTIKKKSTFLNKVKDIEFIIP